MSWDDYTQAILRLDLPEGEIEVAPAAFGRTMGTFPGDGRPIHIITAHNPGGHRSSPDDNALAQSRLTDRVTEAALKHYPAAGGDRARKHIEPSFAVVGLDREQACALGCEFGQDAIFEWSPTGLAVLSCTDARVHYTGWAISPVVDTSPIQHPEGHAAAPHVPTPGQVDWAAEIERTKIDRAAADEDYFRELGSRTGFLFELQDEESDEPAIDVVGTGSRIEVRQTDYPDQLSVDIGKQLPAVLRSRFPDDTLVVISSGKWDAGDIAYTLGGTFDPLYIDAVEWSVSSSDSEVALPMLYETPSSCLVATNQWEWKPDNGRSFSPMSSENGSAELLRIGPLFVVRGEEWANVLKATTADAALLEFEKDSPDQEGLGQTLFVENLQDE